MRSGVWCTILLLPFLALGGEDEGESLPPGLCSGDRSRVVLEVEDHARVEKPPVILTIETEWEIRYVESVEKVDAGRAVAVTRRYQRNRREERRKLGGGATRRERHTGDVEGGELSLRADTGGRVIAPMGQVDEGFLHGLDWSRVLPSARVRRSDTWEIEGGWDLAALFPPLVASTARARYERRRGRLAEIVVRVGPESESVWSATVTFDLEERRVVEAEWTERDEGSGTARRRTGTFERRMLDPDDG